MSAPAFPLSMKVLCGFAVLLLLSACGPPTASIQQGQQQEEQSYRQATLEYEKRKKEEATGEIRRHQALGEAQNLVTQARAADAAGNLRSAFDLYNRALQALPEGDPVNGKPILEALISTAARLDPPPAVPQQARDQALRAEQRLKLAGNDEDLEKVIADYALALQQAPWWADARFNQALVLEKAQRYRDAAEAFRLFLAAAPGSKDEAAVQRRIVELEVKDEQQRPADRPRSEWGAQGSDGRLYGSYGMSRRGQNLTLTDQNTGEKLLEGTLSGQTFSGTYFNRTPATVFDTYRPYCPADFLEQARYREIPITATLSDDGTRLSFTLLTPNINIMGGRCRYEGNLQFNKTFVWVAP